LIDISPKHLDEVLKILQQQLPDARVWAFGSRITAEASAGSDLDLVVHSPDNEALPLGRVREAFRDSNLPFSVELLDWATIPEHFRQEVLKSYVVVQ
jgi:uncharacterized protein